MRTQLSVIQMAAWMISVGRRPSSMKRSGDRHDAKHPGPSSRKYACVARRSATTRPSSNWNVSVVAHLRGRHRCCWPELASAMRSSTMASAMPSAGAEWRNGISGSMTG